jgi:NAD(P)-dependent dehydrogenase (short-subunit alcohol dehydrogenase family)
MQKSTSRRVVVTGATRGIGGAVVDRLAELGHRVGGCGRSHDRIRELQARHPQGHRFDVVNVADSDQVDRWAGELLEFFGGPPDLVFNNAGLINQPAALWQVPPDEMRAVVEVNLLGATWVMQAFLPAMVAAGAGVIVNVSSGWGRVTSPEVAPYCASKWGLEGLTRAVSQEVPDGLAVLTLSPGVVGTDMLRTAWGEAVPTSPTPEAWARIAVPRLLALGPEANGQVLTIP